MNWEETLACIESPRFDAELNFASGTRSFFSGVAEEPVVRGALRLMHESGGVLEAALDRIHDLATAEIDPIYQNPNDTALAVLLWLTYFTDQEWARVAANYVERAPRCWYANRMSQLIVNPTPTMSSNSQTHPDSEDQISYRSSSPAENLNLMSSTPKLRLGANPSMRTAQRAGVETGRQAAQWAVDPGGSRPDHVAWGLGFAETGGVSNLSAQGWTPARTGLSETGDRT